MTNATWTKLKKENTWGLRIEGSVTEGEVVLVSRSNGSKSRETVGKIVWTGNGITLATLGPKPAKAPKAPKAEKKAPLVLDWSQAEREDAQAEIQAERAAEDTALRNADEYFEEDYSSSSDDLPY